MNHQYISVLIHIVFFVLNPRVIPSPCCRADPGFCLSRSQPRVALGEILAVHLVPEPAVRGTSDGYTHISIYIYLQYVCIYI